MTPPSITSTHSQHTEASELEDSLFRKRGERGEGKKERGDRGERGGEGREERGQGRGGEEEKKGERELLGVHIPMCHITVPGGVSPAQPFLEKETQI